MPTPRPIIAAICGPNSGIDRPRDASPTTAVATPRPTVAVPMGRPIAITEPKAIIRMTTAARMPRISLAGNSNFWKTCPPYSTSRPGTRTSCPNSWIASAMCWVVAWSTRVTVSWANETSCPVVLVGASAGRVCWAPSSLYGLTTFTGSVSAACSSAGSAATSSAVRTLFFESRRMASTCSNRAVIAACTSGSWLPCAAVNTIWAGNPSSPLPMALNASPTFFDSLSGWENSVW